MYASNHFDEPPYEPTAEDYADYAEYLASLPPDEPIPEESGEPPVYDESALPF